jgi:hypothetical protein
MKSLLLTTVASLALQSIACAESAQNVGVPDQDHLQRDIVSIVQSGAPQTRDRIVRDQNECGVDHADPVWSTTGALLGYACSHNENGG